MTPATLLSRPADSGNQRLRRVEGGLITTLAVFDHDPLSVAASASLGDAIFVGLASCTVVQVDIDTGAAVVVAGQPGQCAYSGDGGPATQARLRSPTGLAADASGGILVADPLSSVVRRLARWGGGGGAMG